MQFKYIFAAAAAVATVQAANNSSSSTASGAAAAVDVKVGAVAGIAAAGFAALIM